jgi:hypothetical protein
VPQIDFLSGRHICLIEIVALAILETKSVVRLLLRVAYSSFFLILSQLARFPWAHLVDHPMQDHHRPQSWRHHRHPANS